MADHATPNLPSSDYDTTVAFYGRLGFEVRDRDEGWLILVRGELVLEFFLWPDVDPATSGFSCCLRLDDVDAFYAVCRAAALPETTRGWPRIHPPRREDSGTPQRSPRAGARDRGTRLDSASLHRGGTGA